MKKIILIALLFSSIAARAQSSDGIIKEQFDVLFEKYLSQEGIVAVEISELMAQELAERLVKEGDDEAAELMRSIKTISMIVNKNSQPQFWNKLLEFKEAALSNIELINVFSDEDRESHFYFKRPNRKEPVAEFVMLSKSPEKQIILYVIGDFSVSEISKLSFVKEGLNKSSKK